MIMKRLLLILLALLPFLNSYAQKVTIKGNISSEVREDVLVIINDTIRKLNSDNKEHQKNWFKIFNNKKYVVKSVNNTFNVRAKKTDSLYFYSTNNSTKAYLVSDLLKQKYIHIKLDKKPCIEYIECNDSTPKLYVIAATKIKLSYAEDDNYCGSIISIDSKFNAKYQIRENLFGDYKSDTINFTVYDYNGWPAFERYDNVLLYIVKRCDNLIHLKYQFSDIYKTTNGRWATPYKAYNYRNLPDEIVIKPEIIPFENPLEFDTEGLSDEYIIKNFPSPYYRKEADKMIAVYGNYIEDIFTIKQHTILKDYSFF